MYSHASMRAHASIQRLTPGPTQSEGKFVREHEVAGSVRTSGAKSSFRVHIILPNHPLTTMRWFVVSRHV